MLSPRRAIKLRKFRISKKRHFLIFRPPSRPIFGNLAKYQKISKNVENGPPNGDPFWDTFWPSGPSLLSQASLGSQNDSQGLPKSPRDQSKTQFSPIFDGFEWICDDFPFHVSYFLLVCLISFFENFEAYFTKS